MRINKKILALIIFLALFLRLIPLDFPLFTSEEARIAYRGSALVSLGKDEFGRPFPILFNSLEDYQLPATSYMTAFGILLFGKSDLGARLPFIIIGTMLIFLTYQISKIFSTKPRFWLLSALLVANSSALIFLSKIPNETILLVCTLVILFYLLITSSNIIAILLIMTATISISKLAWFILIPFVFYTLFFFPSFLDLRKKILICIFSVIIIIATFSLFLNIPQAKRSLLENNSPLFSDVTITNGINRLRGQGIESNWPETIDRILFNKSHFLMVGFLHWLSNLSPNIYFGQFDENGKFGFSSQGAWPKALIVPAMVGLAFILSKDKKGRMLIPYFLILTFPAIFLYPNKNQQLVALTLPFMAIIMAVGLMNLNRLIATVIICLTIFEVVVNLSYLKFEIKNTNTLRSSGIKNVALDVFSISKNYPVAISDDIASDIVPFIEWYTPFNIQSGFMDILSPYKFRQYSLGNIKIIGSNDNFSSCGRDERIKIFASKRDLNKIQNEFHVEVEKKYIDINGDNIAYLLSNVCIK